MSTPVYKQAIHQQVANARQWAEATAEIHRLIPLLPTEVVDHFRHQIAAPPPDETPPFAIPDPIALPADEPPPAIREPRPTRRPPPS